MTRFHLKFLAGLAAPLLIFLLIWNQRKSLGDWLISWQSAAPTEQNLTGSTQLRAGSESAEIGQTNEAPLKLEYRLEIVAEDLFVPWSLAFATDDRLLLTERSGAVRVIQNGVLQEEPIYTFDEVATGGEKGLSGLAVHPEYEQNRYVYICFAKESDQGLINEIVRLTDEGNQLTDRTVIFSQIPTARLCRHEKYSMLE